MKTSVKIAVTALISAVILSPTLAFSHENGMRIHDRLIRQQQRIELGVENGMLTHKEAKKLKKEQRGIRKLARKFRSDGTLTRAERTKLTKKLNRAGDRIWNLKHNDRERRDLRHLHSYAYQEPGRARQGHSAGIWRGDDRDYGRRSGYSVWH